MGRKWVDGIYSYYMLEKEITITGGVNEEELVIEDLGESCEEPFRHVDTYRILHTPERVDPSFDHHSKSINPISHSLWNSTY